MNDIQRNRLPLPYSTGFVAVDERMIMQLTPREREIANDIIGEHLRQLAENCSGCADLIPGLLDGYMRAVICGEDYSYLERGIEQLEFTDECIEAIRDDAHYDEESKERYLDASWLLEQCLIDIAGELLAAHHLFRAAHNALNVLVAYERILLYILEAPIINTNNTKQP